MAAGKGENDASQARETQRAQNDEGRAVQQLADQIAHYVRHGVREEKLFEEISNLLYNTKKQTRSRTDLALVVSVAGGIIGLLAVFASGFFAGYLELSAIQRELGMLVERDRSIEARLVAVEERLGDISDTQQQVLQQLVSIEQTIKNESDRAAQ